MEIVNQAQMMTTISRKAERAQASIGFVPTMGALHEGHLSLVRRAKTLSDVVVVSIFVNPIQFGQNEDFDRYPRDLPRDLEALGPEGVAYVFIPSEADLYPDGFSTWVVVEGLSQKLCGRSRPDHFRGVTTVVTKLFNIVRPTFAFFGQKDAQQAIIIQRMVRDLNIPTEIVIGPTVREADGLALSSRNRYLSPDERRAAPVLIHSLQEAARRIASGERESSRVLQSMRELIAREPLARIDYLAITDPATLDPVERIARDVLVAGAVFIGKTRLIDNVILSVAA